MRHNNTRAIVLAVTLATAAALGGCSGSEGRQATYLERAQEFFDEGNLEKARIELKNVLQINANNAEARYLIASVDEREQNWGQMYANLNAALESDPKLAKARIKLAQLLIASAQLDKANEQIDKVLEQDPNHAEAYATRAIILLREQKVDEAITKAEKALQLQPGQVNAAGVLAGIYADRDPARAEKLLDDALKINPGNSTLRLIQIKVFSKQNKNEEVIATYKQLMAENTDNLHYPSQLANFYIANQRIDEAEALLRDLVAKHPDKDEAKLLQVEFLSKNRGVEKALAQLEQYSAQAPDNYKLRAALARVYAGSGNPDKAIATYRYTVDKEGKGAEAIDARNRITELQLAQNKRPEAEALIKQVLDLEAENTDALLMRARLALADNEPNNAIPDLRAVLKNSPDSAQALTLLAVAQERVGARDLALDNYQHLLQLNPKNVAALTGSARLQLLQNKLDESKNLLLQAHQIEADNIEVIRLLVDVYSRQKEWDKALELSNGLLINQNTAAIGHYMTGLVHARSEDLPQAIEDFKKSVAKEPRAIEPLQMLINAFMANKQQAQATAYLENHVKTYPEQAHALEFLGSLYRQTGKPQQAEVVLTQLLKKQPTRVSAYRELAAVYAAKGEHQQIDALFQRGLQQNPDNTALLALLGEYYQNTGKDQQALETYNKLHKLAPQSDIVKNNLAVLLIEKFPSEENLRRAQSLTAEFADADNPMFLDTLGWLHYKMKNYPQSVALLENAVRKSGNAPELRYHLGMAYLQSNMNDKAKIELGKAIEAPGKFPGRDEAELALSKL